MPGDLWEAAVRVIQKQAFSVSVASCIWIA